MIKPDSVARRVEVKSERYNVNPVATQAWRAWVPAPKYKVERNRYREEDNKARQDSESSFGIESAEVLADWQSPHLQKAIGNEITGEGEKYPQPNPTKQNIREWVNEVTGKDQDHTNATQAIERGQMSFASIHYVLLSKLRAPARTRVCP